MELTKVKGIGAKTAEQYHKLGIDTAEELIRHFPRGYDFYKKPIRVCDAKEGEIVSLLLTIVGQGSGTRFGKRSLVHFKAADETGEVRLTYFNMPYLRSVLKPKSKHVFRGFLKTNARGGKYLEQPQLFSPENYAEMEERFLPRYALTQGLKNAAVIKHMQKALLEVLPVPEYLSEEDREANGLI
ncbi:MAG: ATP-dependent DNA helicase RecG, partial [Lachnospiraceae bacterium]|nr:ATP-dependent DNA helicase RecG [Lachnospiraceae bacterium]